MKRLILIIAIFTMFGSYSYSQWIQQGIGLDWWNVNWYCIQSSSTMYFCADIGGFGIRIFKTTDGGNTWTIVYNNNSDQLSRGGGRVFPNGVAFAAFNNKVMKSVNDCQSWTQIFDTGSGFDINALVFPTEQIGYVFYHQSNPPNNWVVLKTTDGGNTWNIVYQDANMEFNQYNNAMFLNSTVGCISGYWNNLFITWNGGISWTTSTCPGEIVRAFMMDEQTIYATSYNSNNLYKSTNGGGSWQILTVPTSSMLKDVFFIGSTGWVCTQDGHVFLTTDAGATWELQPTPASFLKYVAFADLNNGWGWGSVGILIHTENGGVPTLLPPVITTEEATNVMETTATLNGTVNANNQETTVIFEYGLTDTYGSEVSAVPGTVSGSDVTPVYADISGLQENTTYHYRCVGTNSAGTTNGNDMTFTTSCAIPGDAGSIRGMTEVCDGDAGLVYTIDPIPGATGYSWTVPDGAVIVSGQNTPSITVDYTEGAESGMISVFGINDCGAGNGSDLEVTLNPVPEAPEIFSVNDSLLFSNTLIGNQWYLNGESIPGATKQDYIVEVPGDYYDIVTLNDCSSQPSNVITIPPPVNIHEIGYPVMLIYPNPCRGRLNVLIERSESSGITLTVFNSLGNQVLKETFQNGTENTRYSINLEGLPDGIYFLKITSNETEITKKIIIRK